MKTRSKKNTPPEAESPKIEEPKPATSPPSPSKKRPALPEPEASAGLVEHPKLDKLTIHRTNLFRPRPMAVLHLAHNKQTDLLLTTKGFPDDATLRELTIIEVCRTHGKGTVSSFVVDEIVTGITWIGRHKFLTVSKQLTITIYDTKRAVKVTSLLTDYGAILCMKYFSDEGLLLTATEYGYVAAYRIDAKGNQKIVPVAKLTKISSQINALEFVAVKGSPRSDVQNPKQSERSDKKSKSKDKLNSTKSGKRKRNDLSDDDDDDESDDDGSEAPEQIYLDNYKITIFGASSNQVVVWNYHRGSILETLVLSDDKTCCVTALLALQNGDVVAGDSMGFINFIDHKTLTCRQTNRPTSSDINCLAINPSGSDLIVSGDDSTVYVFRCETEEGPHASAEFKLFEKTESHTHPVTCSLYINENEFFTGAIDGLTIRHLVNRRNGAKLCKTIRRPSFKEQVKFSAGEMLFQYERCLEIWRMPPSKTAHADGNSNDSSPKKMIKIKTGDFVQTCAFNDRWIAYASRKSIHIFDRSDGKITPLKPLKMQGSCNKLQFGGDHSLVAASSRCLHFVDMENLRSTKDKRGKMVQQPRLVKSESLKSQVQQMQYIAPLNTLVVVCSHPKAIIYTYNLKTEPEHLLKFERKSNFRLPFKNTDILFFENHSGAGITLFTSANQIIPLSLDKPPSECEAAELVLKQPIKGLPHDANIQGIVHLEGDTFLLHDESRFFKVKSLANHMLNMVANRYKFVISLDNQIFSQTDNVILVELNPNEYLQFLPATRPRHKFGQK